MAVATEALFRPTLFHGERGGRGFIPRSLTINWILPRTLHNARVGLLVRTASTFATLIEVISRDENAYRVRNHSIGHCGTRKPCCYSNPRTIVWGDGVPFHPEIYSSGYRLCAYDILCNSSRLGRYTNVPLLNLTGNFALIHRSSGRRSVERHRSY